jgi:hypothetical protein
MMTSRDVLGACAQGEITQAALLEGKRVSLEGALIGRCSLDVCSGTSELGTAIYSDRRSESVIAEN